MDNWEVKKLKDIAKIVGGGTPKTKIKEYWADEIVWLSPTDLPKIGEIAEVSNSIRKISKIGLENSSAKLLPIGTVCFSSRATIGKIGISSVELATNQGFKNFICKDNLYNRYLAYVLRYLTPRIESLSNSTTFKEVSTTAIRKVEIPVPPLSEQHRIVSKLDALFFEVDASLALIDQNIIQAEALKMSVLDEELNTDSEEIKISNLLVNTKNVNPKDVFKEEEFTYIDISSINKDLYRIESPKTLKGSEAPSRAKKEVELGDIIFATTRPNLKNVAIVDKEYTNSIASTGFCVLRPKKDKLINSFLFYFLISNKLQDLIQPFIRGAQYPAISDRNLKGIKLATPSIEAQQKIVQKLDSLFAEIDALVLDYTQKRANLEALKSSLLDQAFKGEL